MDIMYWGFTDSVGWWSVAAGRPNVLERRDSNPLEDRQVIWRHDGLPQYGVYIGYRIPDPFEMMHPVQQNTKPSNPKDAVGTNKVGMSVLPMNVQMEVALALTEGALKYGKHNYRGVGVRSSVYYDAAFRHLGAWWEGEDIDAESGLSHITKAIAGLTVLRDCMMRGNVVDDRPPKCASGWMEPLNKRVPELKSQYRDRTPKNYFEKENQ